ncbi:hypothetical protein [Anaerosporobacter faecicola]|uniref:hypothetical protein n=1 Tax=Anaerosporobacter faecicola TaxID=2718714 RepID=UPI00143B1CAA|nr:hypothetical protein [Anaerosporobacter faecicola]
MIKSVNEQGVVFQYTYGEKKGNYNTYIISSDNAKMYYYSVKFVHKLNEVIQNKLKENHPGIVDLTTYPDEHTRKTRILYDFVVATFLEDYGWFYDDYDYHEYITGFDEKTTFTEAYFDNFDNYDYDNSYTDFIVKEHTTDPDSYDHYVLRSYEEFAALPNLEELSKEIAMNEINSQEALLLNHTFGELSDAMKIYAIDYSTYFSCYFSRPDFGMVYKTDYTSTYGYKAMKTMYENKAEGVCMIFARYECILFEQLGMTNYYNSSYQINHAWSVVKVKNSKGKILWIPFDYGIGPSPSLVIDPSQAKYIDTEKKRYKLYLNGIKGAPSKKNFNEDDFN